MAEYILVINPGSNSTKVAVLDGEKELHSMNIDHPAEELKKFVDINEQMPFRKVALMKYLESQSLKPSDLAGISS